MSFLKKTYLLLFCMCLVAGCYEDTVQLTLNADGSGVIKQKLVLSERFIVANEENSGSQKVPIPNKVDIVRTIGSAIEIKYIKQTNLPDGGRIIELEGTFSSPEQFFLDSD